MGCLRGASVPLLNNVRLLSVGIMITNLKCHCEGIRLKRISRGNLKDDPIPIIPFPCAGEGKEFFIRGLNALFNTCSYVPSFLPWRLGKTFSHLSLRGAPAPWQSGGEGNRHSYGQGDNGMALPASVGMTRSDASGKRLSYLHSSGKIFSFTEVSL